MLKLNTPVIILGGLYSLMLVCFFSSVCAGDINRPQGTEEYNVILICFDTLRADHLSCYGYPRGTSPNVDKLAENGVLFEWAISQSNFTLPSHASLFTSKYVHTHKADSVEKRLSDKEVTLAEVLKSKGYRTAAFIYNAEQLNPQYGLNQGFDTYYFGNELSRKKPSLEKTMPMALRWIEANKKRRFFVFLHSNNIHEPYHSIYENFFDQDYKGRLDNEFMGSSNPDFRESEHIVRTPREIKHIIAHYDGGIKYADSFLPRLMHKLEELNLKGKTIIIFFSDHGEILADHGVRFLHGFSLYDEEVHVPLIIRHPKMQTGNIRIKSQVQLIDVMPTILDYLGIPRVRGMEGESLAPLIDGLAKGRTDKYAYAECIRGESDSPEIISREMMVREPLWKMIATTWELKGKGTKIPSGKIGLHNGAILILPGEFKTTYDLYDLKNDPGEKVNRINGKGEAIRKVKIKLLERLLSQF